MQSERHAYLASALSGRSIATEVGKNGSLYTDGERIMLPAIGDDSLAIGVAVQAALLRCRSLEYGIAIRLLGQEKVAARYLTLEAARAAAVVGMLMPRMVQRCIQAHWQGEITTSAEDSLHRAMADKSIPEAPAKFGIIRPMVLLQGQGRSGGSTPSKNDLRRAEKNKGDTEREEDENDSTERSSILSRLAGPVSVNSPISEFVRRMFGARSSKNLAGSQGGGVELQAGSVQWVKQISTAAKVIGTVLGVSGIDRSAMDGHVYPEWDCEGRRYIPKWCSVFHMETTATHELEQATPDRILRRRLARLGTTFVQHHKQSDGENLDDDSLISYIVDTASGYSGDERVYSAKRKTGRDLSVIVLLDASGSTGDQQSGGTSIWEAQRTLALSTIAALDDLGDSVAAYGFRSFGRGDIRFLRIKDFAERFSQHARSRLHSLKPAGFTRLGAAIRHATHLIASKGHTEHQLLIVVSDGLPYDVEYEDLRAEQDVRKALGEAEARGVGCVCLSVGSSRNAAAQERVWGNVGHASLQSPADLHRFAEPLFRAAIRRADMRVGRKDLERKTATLKAA